MFCPKNYLNLEVTNVTKEYSSVIAFGRQASIVIFVPFVIKNATDLKDIAHKKILGIDEKNRIVTFKFSGGIEILVDTRDEHLNGSEVFHFRIQHIDVIVRSDDLDNFFESIK